jgi:hypothetical protein
MPGTTRWPYWKAENYPADFMELIATWPDHWRTKKLAPDDALSGAFVIPSDIS